MPQEYFVRPEGEDATCMVILQPIFLGIIAKIAPIETAYTAVGTDPDPASLILDDIEDLDLREAIFKA